ncbi:class I SAM-dependent methyltransferase [Phyllobacterium ifriqiyense]|uniref:class I SAM-dependent methyltransferase n=1 Tax=Phyllobacterium ifriqiyense TaxID=314238 RepID=UPI00339A06F1
MSRYLSRIRAHLPFKNVSSEKLPQPVEDAASPGKAAVDKPNAVHEHVLIDELTAVQESIAPTDREIALAQENHEIREELTRAYRLVDDLVAKTATGKIVEFEYGHLPKKRDYGSLPHMGKTLSWFVENEGRFSELISSFDPFFSKASEIEDVAVNSTDPSWRNPWFPFVDAITTYCLIAFYKPKRYIEVGSGFSTKFARRAIRDFSPTTKLISIDPYPRDEINEICDETMRVPLQDVDPAFFATLTADDIFFLDSSHRVDQGSDVAVFFCEILPTFPKNMIYGVHDIFYPDQDYPVEWLDRHYSEQYMMMTYLFGGADGDQIIMPCHYVSQRPNLYGKLESLMGLPNIAPATSVVLGLSLWMRKG